MADLSKRAKKLRKEILDGFDFTDDPHSIAILDMGLMALSEADRMLEVVERDGELVPGQKGVMKPHPLLTSIRDNRLVFLRCIKELNLPIDDGQQPKKLGRPPKYGQYRG